VGALNAQRCAVCGGSELVPHLNVAGDLGPEGLIPTTRQFGTALSDIVRCTACGHMQLSELPSEASLAEAYGEAESSDYLEEEIGQRATGRWALERIERHAQLGRLLDLGCWVGYLLDEARARGWEPVGVEPSAFASSFARSHFGLDVRHGDLFSTSLEPRSFDAVVLGDVIEHLPDPGAALDRIASLAAPGGVLYMALPDAGSRVARMLGSRWWSVIPTHVHYFTRASLRRLLVDHGWELLELATAPKAFTIRYYAGRIGGYSEPAARALEALTERARIADRLWAPDFRDRMAALARIA
jgi:SAM-dependent methyltransferase